jgi:hypothetical protein
MERELADVGSVGADCYVGASTGPLCRPSHSFLFAWLAYRARSLWPAVFFHSFHNTISQWLFPKFFAGGDDALWLGEGGLLPVAGYVVLGVSIGVWMQRRGPSWAALVHGALGTAETKRAIA